MISNMIITKITAHQDIFLNQETAQLLMSLIPAPTLGKVQDLAQSVYGKSQGQFYVATLDDVVIGLVGGSEIDRGLFILRHLIVNSDFQRKGVATALLKHAIEARQYNEVTAEVAPDVVNFFRDFGFACKPIKNHPLDLDRFACKWRQ